PEAGGRARRNDPRRERRGTRGRAFRAVGRAAGALAEPARPAPHREAGGGGPVTATTTPSAAQATLGIGRGGSALVTGASSGIGEAFARTLAARGVSLLLTALPQEAEGLRAIAEELERAHGIRCLAVPVDLSMADGAERLHGAADDLGFVPDLIVNSAGVGASGPFAEIPLADHLRMIHVNVEGLVRVTHLFVSTMVARGGGAVVNVASTAAFQPLPYFSVYAASKAFVL